MARSTVPAELPAEVDGPRLRHAVACGARAVAAARAELDRINVFPVADGDTGTNLAATLGGALEEAAPASGAGPAARALADAALGSSAGNSGVIFAQFLEGLAEGLAAWDAAPPEGLARAAALGAARAREAVAAPAEGTMLTVMHAWAEALAAGGGAPDPEGALTALEAALEATPGQLPALARAGVVDAGAAGFAHFARGFQQGLVAPELPAAAPAPPMSPAPGHPPVPDAMPDLRYCTEIVLEEAAAGAEVLRGDLQSLGDSVVVAGHGTRLKVHVHTDHPERVAERLAERGRLGRQKVDDLCLQHAAHHRRLADVAVVTDTACDLPRELLDRWQIHQVPLTIHWGAEQYVDRRTLSAERFYRLLDARPDAPRTAQPPPGRFERLYRTLADSHREILSVHLSRHLSGTLEAARAAAARVDAGRIRVVDGRQLTTALGLTVLGVAEAVAGGADGRAAAARAEDLAARTEVLVAVPSLDAMVRGGRIGPVKGFLARRLGLLPVVSVDRQGRSCLRGKAFSFEGSLARILRRLGAHRRRLRPERWALAHAGAEPLARDLAERAEAVLGVAPAYLMDTAPIIGAHAGTGSVCIAVQWSDIPR